MPFHVVSPDQSAKGVPDTPVFPTGAPRVLDVLDDVAGWRSRGAELLRAPTRTRGLLALEPASRNLAKVSL